MEKRLEFCTWSQASARLKLALGDHYYNAESEVSAGRETCYKVDDTYLLLRGEIHNDRRELVVVGLDGDMAIGTLCAIAFAKKYQFNSVRAHFFRRGALRFLSRKLSLPVKLIEKRGEERIIRLELDNGR